MSFLRVVFQVLTFIVISVTSVHAHGTAPQNGACFALADKAARFCIPVDMKLIDIEVTDGLVWAHFEDGYFTVTVNMWSESRDTSPRPDSFAAAYPSSYSSHDINRYEAGPRRWAFSYSGGYSVLEAEVGDAAEQAFFSEISGANGTMQIVMKDFSLKNQDVQIDFVERITEIRLLTQTRDDVLQRLHPYSDMDGADVQ